MRGEPAGLPRRREVCSCAPPVQARPLADRWVSRPPPLTSARPVESSNYSEIVVSRIFTSWNQMTSWLRQLDGLRSAA